MYLLVVSVLAFICGVSHGSLQTYDFESLCPPRKGNVTLNIRPISSGSSSSFILRAVPNSLVKLYSWDLNCTLVIVPPPSHDIVVSVKKIELRSSCVDNLTLSDSFGNVYTYCDKYSSELEIQSRNYIGTLTVTFRTAGFLLESQIGYDGFILTVTGYKRTLCFSSTEFQCNNGRCISKDLRCDGHNHCGDRSEQLGCAPTCRPGQFTCSNGRCISYLLVCNGIDNCGDRSDERNCFATPGGIIEIHSKTSGSSVSRIVGAVFGSFFLILALILSLIYHRSRMRRIVTRTTVNRQPAPYTITHIPPTAPTQPTFSLGLPGPQSAQYGNPYPPLGKEMIDHPPPYSEVVK